ncbi:MAG: alpha amylase C-terminal domain-containing protein, partial [Rhodoplanes sp.]
NHDFAVGYRIQHPAIANGRWHEIFNSDARDYGGLGLINAGTIETVDGGFTALLPANSVVVFERR